jgi:DNA segregation ATPase FtsK/SpoIIIE, S-DNA-T family
MSRRYKHSKREQTNTSAKSTVVRIASRDTVSAIFGIISIVVAIFFILAAFRIGGRVGEIIYNFFSFLFGVGYYLVPAVFVVLGASFFRSRERSLALVQIIGSSILLFSSLGIIGLISNIQNGSPRGGVVGQFIAKPFMALFDLYASIILLLALIIISTLIIFDISIKLDTIAIIKKLFSRKDSDLALAESSVIDEAVNKIAKTESQPLRETEIQRTEKSTGPKSEGFFPLANHRRGQKWSPPPLSIFEKDRGKPGVGDIKANANLIKRTLLNFGIVVEMDEVSIGPSVTRYALKPAEGVKLSRILGLQNNLELALAAHPVRIEAPIPGKSLVGIEVPNTQKATVGLGSLLSEDGYSASDKPLLITLGRDIAGNSHFANLSKMPHLLIAGATGSGKSVAIHAITASLLSRNPPENLKFIMIDPKRVELTLYNGIPHLLTPVITEPKKAILALKWLAREMERRYDILEKTSVRDIDSYHKNIYLPELDKIEKNKNKEDGNVIWPDPMPYIVVIVDELADLMQSYPRELEAAIVRLAQMSRAVGIHLILSTQRPSVNVITGLIKANIPSRIALQVASQVDSRTILDSSGAEKLLGQGDMLYLSSEMSKPTRIQSAFISENEVKELAKYLRESYIDEIGNQINLSAETTSTNAIFSSSVGNDDTESDDDLYEEARVTVMQAGKASTSFLQRKLRVGYARAARLMDLLEERGVIGPGSGAKPREVISNSREYGSLESDNDTQFDEFDESEAGDDNEKELL